MDGATMTRGGLRGVVATVPAAVRRAFREGAPSDRVMEEQRGMSNLALAGWVGLAAVALVIVALVGRDQHAPTGVVVLIVISVVVAEAFPVRVGQIRYAGSDFAVWLAIPILGAWPAVAIATTGILVDAVLRRVPARLALCNVAVFAFVAAVGSAFLAGVRELGFAVPGEVGLPAAVFLLAWTTDALNLVLLTLGSPLMRGVDVRDAIREHWLPVLPWMTLTAGVAAGSVHAYYTLGPIAVVAAVAVHAGAQALLKTIEREERQRAEVHAAFAARDRHLADALEAEARERRRVAAELHDDALQNIVLARQDIAGGAIDRADERLTAAIAGVRRLAARQYDAEARPAEVAGQLRELLGVVTALPGFACTLEVQGVDDERVPGDLVVALVRELVVNAIRHSGGTRVDVQIARDDEFLDLTVTDDGQGFELGRTRGRLRDGHLGLTVAEDRLTAQGGSLVIARGPAGGARVRARIPLLAAADQAADSVG